MAVGCRVKFGDFRAGKRQKLLMWLDGCKIGLTVESEEGEVPHLRWSQAPPLPWPRPGSADISTRPYIIIIYTIYLEYLEYINIQLFPNQTIYNHIYILHKFIRWPSSFHQLIVSGSRQSRGPFLYCQLHRFHVVVW